MPADLSSIRHQLTVLARPNQWRPHEVICAETGEPFTDAGAWEHVADLLEQGHELEAIPQEEPAGVTAYVMHVSMATETLYIKVRLGAGFILGRSFHYSDKAGAK